MDSNTSNLKILMFPWLAHGHISPYLELGKQLIARNFTIYLCSTPVNLSFIKEELDDQTLSQIKLIQLHLPTLPSLPPHYHTTRNLPTHLMPILKQAFDLAKPAFIHILRTHKPHCLVYDFFQHWAPEAASDENIPAIHFLTTNAACTSYAYHLGKPPENDTKYLFPVFIPAGFETYGKKPRTKSSGITDVERAVRSMDRSSSVIAVKTLREIDGKFIDYLSVLTGKEIVPMGPLVRRDRGKNQNQTNSIIEWLDRKPRDSIVYASFGSEYFMSNEEIEEMAHGLELSGANFIWVVRFFKDEKEGKEVEIEEVLPSGFLERIGERGMVVMGWAEQEKILSHPSTGGFLSHCGWSSTMEGLLLGVPLIALPLQLDQPINARLLVEELGVAVEIERGSGGVKRFEREKVAKGIRVAMVEQEGEKVRRLAKEMSECLKNRGEYEIDVFADRLMKVCRESGKKEM